MRKITFYALFASLALISCKKNDPPANTGTGTVFIPEPNSMSLKVDGIPFPTVETEVSYFTPGHPELMIFDQDTGPDNSHRTVELYVPDTLSVGTHAISGLGVQPQIGFEDTTGYYMSYSGSVIVTVNDTVHKLMKGTFDVFVGSSVSGISHHLTNGAFVLNYQ